ncbi:MAG: hypothetical protein Q8P80_02405, partial [Candidatus Levybacteria bacterium]|nr:hypothetical protein [Candidatus Levybacteria bacterium]
RNSGAPKSWRKSSKETVRKEEDKLVIPIIKEQIASGQTYISTKIIFEKTGLDRNRIGRIVARYKAKRAKQSKTQ